MSYPWMVSRGSSATAIIWSWVIGGVGRLAAAVASFIDVVLSALNWMYVPSGVGPSAQDTEPAVVP